MMNYYIIIPAVLGSTRLPIKLILENTGKPLLQHTWENCKLTPDVKDVIIATDNEKVQKICENFGATVIYDEQPTIYGSDRVIKTAMEHLNDYDAVVNVQGECPDIQPTDIKRILDSAALMPEEPIVTCLYYEDEPSDNTDLVKVVTNKLGHALYFSRKCIPHESPICQYAVGIYGFSKTFVRLFYDVLKQPWESLMKTERLEQLHFLDAGFQMTMLKTDFANIEIDSPELYDKFIQKCKNTC